MKKQKTTKQKVSIKNMPAYDPDSEVTSLAYTIPFWISLINRVLTNNLEKTSIDAKQNLKRELNELKFNVETLILHMEGNNDRL